MYRIKGQHGNDHSNTEGLFTKEFIYQYTSKSEALAATQQAAEDYAELWKSSVDKVSHTPSGLSIVSFKQDGEMSSLPYACYWFTDIGD